jgi:hypothetical protein
MANKSKKDEAQSRFTKAQRAEVGKKAISEYEADRAAVLAKTERLKALRLARDAEQAAALKVAAPAKAKKKTGKRPRGTLSSWLDEQQGGGRRS